MADGEKPAQEMNPALEGSVKEAPQEQQDDIQGTRGSPRWIEQAKEFFASGWMFAIPIVTILWVVVTLIYALQLPSGVRWGAFAVAVFIASSSFLLGGLVGFLFGIPRAVQGSTAPTGAAQYQANTNLEQVSDWLTKIIVGVGLVQIGRVIPGLTRYAESLKVPLGGQASSSAFGLALTIANLLIGFFLFYLWSRSLLKKELEELETATHVTAFGLAEAEPGTSHSDRRRTDWRMTA
jgi:hypothetical protein